MVIATVTVVAVVAATAVLEALIVHRRGGPFMRRRPWPLTALFLALACGRTGMGTAQQNAGGNHGPDVVDTGEATTSTGDAAGATAGPCGEATCLSSLLQTCAPAGSCSRQGGGGPSGVGSSACYANGVTVGTSSGLNGMNVVTTLTVSRKGVRCYNIEGTSGSSTSATTYVISGPGGEVATAVTADKAGNVSVTCQGQKPVLVDYACLKPVSTGTDGCTLGECP